MFGFKLFNRPVQVTVKHIISQGARLIGNFCFTDGVCVEGTLVGPVNSVGKHTSVLVGIDGVIEGPVVSDTVIIVGTIIGDINCSKVILKGGGHVVGNIKTAFLEVEKGAIFKGSCCCEEGYSPFPEEGYVKKGELATV